MSGAIQKTTGKTGNILFETVAKEVDELDEALFVDSVSRNLSKGRFLILIVGDGIRQGVENISNFLQQHAGIDFTFGLIELGLYKVPKKKRYIVQPRILARTFTVERAVFRAEGFQVKMESQPNKVVSHKTTGRRSNISEEQYFEELSLLGDQVSQELRTFLDELSSLDIFPVFGSSSLNLRWLPDENLKMNFGCIYKTGVVVTGPSNWIPEKIGNILIGHRYQQKIASIIPGANVREHENQSCWEVHKNGKRIRITDLLPVKTEWKKIIGEIQSDILQAISS